MHRSFVEPGKQPVLIAPKWRTILGMGLGLASVAVPNSAPSVVPPTTS